MNAQHCFAPKKKMLGLDTFLASPDFNRKLCICNKKTGDIMMVQEFQELVDFRVHNGLPNQRQSTVLHDHSFLQAVASHSWDACREEHISFGIWGGGFIGQMDPVGLQSKAPLPRLKRHCLLLRFISTAVYMPGSSRLPLHCLIKLWWFSRASCRIFPGWSIFHRHSVPTGFV